MWSCGWHTKLPVAQRMKNRVTKLKESGVNLDLSGAGTRDLYNMQVVPNCLRVGLVSALWPLAYRCMLGACFEACKSNFSAPIMEIAVGRPE